MNHYFKTSHFNTYFSNHYNDNEFNISLRNIQLRSLCEKHDKDDSNNIKKSKNEKQNKRRTLEDLLNKMNVDSQKSLDKAKILKADSSDEENIKSLKVTSEAVKMRDKVLLNELLNVKTNKKSSPEELISQMLVLSGKRTRQRAPEDLDGNLNYKKSERTPRRSNLQDQKMLKNFFDSSALDIFTIAKEESVKSKLQTWEKLEQDTLRQCFLHPAANQFQHLINLTNAGKLWKFPIDNEIDLNQTESFTDHVFLEEHLSWCEKKGPVRRFMDLVVSGLSKNPYITVQEKIDHIQFYKTYFETRTLNQVQ